MKKIIVLFAVTLIFIASGVFADFVPPQLRISAPDKIQYEFIGDPLKFDVTVSGTTAQLVFLVYTKDKADQIPDMQNGMLAWHLINKVDTCIYLSDVKNLPIGKTTIEWNGKDNAGGKLETSLVPPGDYTYYLWGFDAQTQKIKATFPMYYPGWDNMGTLIEKDEQGGALPNPIFHMRIDETKGIAKWVIGNEPSDSSFTETSTCINDLPEGFTHGNYSCFDPKDHDFFYMSYKDTVNEIKGFWKFAWTPDGNAVREPLWGEGVTYSCDAANTRSQVGMCTDGTYLFGHQYIYSPIRVQKFLVLDFDGEVVDELDVQGENERRGLYSERGEWAGIIPHWVTFRNNVIVAHAHACYTGAMDYYRYAVSEDIEDLYLWGNGNGDYVGDTQYQPDAAVPWDCYGVSMYGLGTDANNFTAQTIKNQGAISFCLFGPDGTGIGNFGYAGEIDGRKTEVDYCDYGSSYDGMYTDNLTPLVEGESNGGMRFTAGDSFKGIISSTPVGVEENAPAVFSVAQNLPNPFNPTTTIGFTLPDAGIVSIDVYNVAGQKVDTVVNEYMNTGSHSVVWDGSEFSTGVYFYTVKFNNFTKSMKMTLMK